MFWTLRGARRQAAGGRVAGAGRQRAGRHRRAGGQQAGGQSGRDWRGSAWRQRSQSPPPASSTSRHRPSKPHPASPPSQPTSCRWSASRCRGRPPRWRPAGRCTPHTPAGPTARQTQPAGGGGGRVGGAQAGARQVSTSAVRVRASQRRCACVRDPGGSRRVLGPGVRAGLGLQQPSQHPPVPKTASPPRAPPCPPPALAAHHQPPCPQWPCLPAGGAPQPATRRPAHPTTHRLWRESSRYASAAGAVPGGYGGGVAVGDGHIAGQAPRGLQAGRQGSREDGGKVAGGVWWAAGGRQGGGDGAAGIWRERGSGHGWPIRHARRPLHAPEPTTSMQQTPTASHTYRPLLLHPSCS